MNLEIHSTPTRTEHTCIVSKMCSFAQLDKDDMVYMEAYDKLLESWLTLVQDEEHFPRGCFVQPAIQVFNSYIQCHLAAPDGTRNLVRPVFHHNVKYSQAVWLSSVWHGTRGNGKIITGVHFHWALYRYLVGGLTRSLQL